MSCLSNIFNPPENEIDFNSFVKFSKWLFQVHLFKFEALSVNSSPRATFLYKAKQLFTWFCLLSMVIAASSMTAFVFVNISDFLAASNSLTNIVTISLIGLKAFVTVLKRETICDVMKSLEASVGTNRKHKMKSYLSSYHQSIKLYSIVFIATFFPILFPIIPYMASSKMQLTVNYWYPFDAFQLSTFPIAFAWNVWTSWVSLTFLLATDSLLYALIEVISMEFDMLKIDLLSLKASPSHERLSTIKSLNQRHIELIELSDKLQNVYAVTFLFSFVVSSLMMCFVAFQLSTAKKLSAYTFYVPYLGLVSGQVLLLCVYGQKLIDSSSSVADGAYECGWHEMRDNRLKKLLILIIARGQRPSRLTAMGFADISLPSFTSVSTKPHHMPLQLSN
jgi:7tm Odorant receptor